MTILDVYHNVVGDQAKVYIHTIKWGLLYAQMSINEGQKTIARRKTVKRLRSQVPNKRVHISGEMYVH